MERVLSSIGANRRQRSLTNAFLVLLLLMAIERVNAQASFSRFETFDRYDPTMLSYSVAGVSGEHVDPRTLGVSWDVNDFIVPGNGGLDIVISRSFNRLSHVPSDMGHWYFGVPRIQIPTSPWRGPYDPARADTGTSFAAWNNLRFRLNNGAASICSRAGQLVDATVTGSLNGQVKGGIMFAAPILLVIPGQEPKVLLDKSPSASQFPADARYVTNDNWYAKCLPPNPQRAWGGFEVVSPSGDHYIFDFIQYLVPGDYGTLSSGGWAEMGISRVEDAHGNALNYVYDLAPGGTDLLSRIEASDGRVVTLDYYPGSRLGVDVQGSPLALISAVNIEADGQQHTIEYEYCDFSDIYILNFDCDEIDLGPDRDLPVLTQVNYPNGTRTQYSYHPTLYSANVLLDWGGFEFLLTRVKLPTGGHVRYDYDDGYSPIFLRTDAPAPRLAQRHTTGRGISPGTWRYTYDLDGHIETTTMTGPVRKDVYEFYEGTGTYEFMIARYPGQYQWPDASPTDYDELLGKLRRHSVFALDGALLQATDYSYALLNPIGKQWYGSNWLGWPTLVLAQIRPIPPSLTTLTDYQSGTGQLQYRNYTPATSFDEYANPLVLYESGQDGSVDDDWYARETNYSWSNDVSSWLIGWPDTQETDGVIVNYDYHPNSPLVSRVIESGVATDYSYDSQGNLTATRWVLNGQTFGTNFSAYHRGVAQTVEHIVDPSVGHSLMLNREVDDLGRTIRESDFSGNQTVYQYDSMGRLNYVAPPLTAPITINYSLTPGGNWNSIEQARGTRRRIVDLDGFGRATLVRDYGDARPGEPPLAKLWDYDKAGRIIFESDAYEWADGGSTSGTEIVYDEFNRILAQTHDADGSSFSYCYRSSCNTGDYGQYYDGTLDNGFVITNEEGYQIAWEYASFARPLDGAPTRVVQQLSGADSPEGIQFITTSIVRDVFGKMLEASQGDTEGDPVVRRYAYNERQLLAQEMHPETGLTEHQYDERGNRTSTSIEALPPTLTSYDGLNRITSINYPGSANDVAFSYDENGILASVMNARTRWDYLYDAEHRLVSESLVVDGQSVAFSYDYDQQGSLASVTYPSGNSHDLGVDDFGRPRRLGSVVSQADWWPDGGLKAATYGNGVVTTISRTPRLFPDVRQIAQAGAVLVHHDYDYDRAGNLTSLIDSVQPWNSIQMNYDGINRLVLADSYWGSGQIQYDAVGNILAKYIGAHRLDYSYDEQRNRLESIGADANFMFGVDYDDYGNISSNGLYDFEYNAASQLSKVEQIPDVEWFYDGKGHRTIREEGGADVISAYDQAGRLLYSDRCAAENISSEFLYLGTELVARQDEPCDVGCHP